MRWGFEPTPIWQKKEPYISVFGIFNFSDELLNFIKKNQEFFICQYEDQKVTIRMIRFSKKNFKKPRAKCQRAPKSAGKFEKERTIGCRFSGKIRGGRVVNAIDWREWEEEVRIPSRKIYFGIFLSIWIQLLLIFSFKKNFPKNFKKISAQCSGAWTVWPPSCSPSATPPTPSDLVLRPPMRTRRPM